MTEPDILIGYKSIGRFLSLSPRVVEWQGRKGTIPLFRMGGSICARKSTLLAWLDEQERQFAEERKAATRATNATPETYRRSG